MSRLTVRYEIDPPLCSLPPRPGAWPQSGQIQSSSGKPAATAVRKASQFAPS